MSKLAWLTIGIAWLAGCGADPGSGRPESDGSSRAAVSGGAGAGAPAGSTCAPANATRACQCGASAGRQVCGASRSWNPCECQGSTGGGAGSGAVPGAGDPALADADPQQNKLPAHFDWLRTDPGSAGGSASCMPGHYEGMLDGGYQSPVAFQAPVPIVSIDVTGNPGLQFDLASGGNGEFLTVTGGHVDGTALAIFPFRVDFADGQLDCATGKFRAKLVNGSYDVFFGAFIPGQTTTYQFEGYAVADYDPSTRSFVNGRWSVAENGEMPPDISPGQDPPPFPAGFSGGTGTWTTQFVR
ncbi:MAG: hypothetical protein ACHQ53_16825 [Polyangiales bacterium]